MTMWMVIKLNIYKMSLKARLLFVRRSIRIARPTVVGVTVVSALVTVSVVVVVVVSSSAVRGGGTRVVLDWNGTCGRGITTTVLLLLVIVGLHPRIVIFVRFGIRSFSLVPYICMKSGLPICIVCDNLHSSVGQLYAIFSSNLVAITHFLPFVVVSTVVVFDLVTEFVGLRLKKLFKYQPNFEKVKVIILLNLNNLNSNHETINQNSTLQINV